MIINILLKSNFFILLLSVPYREIPQYSDRRKGASMTPSLRALLRSRSDPRINVAGLDSRSTSAASSPFGGVARRHHLGADSDSACSISVASSGSGESCHACYTRTSATLEIRCVLVGLGFASSWKSTRFKFKFCSLNAKI